jgi:hypothetical protein
MGAHPGRGGAERWHPEPERGSGQEHGADRPQPSAATNSARSLPFATAGVTGQLNGAVGASALIAENIAKASSNAKIAASATGIGAVVAILGTIAAFTVNWKKRRRKSRTRFAISTTRRRSSRRRPRATTGWSASSRSRVRWRASSSGQKMEHFYRKFPELQEAIRRKAAAARDASSADSTVNTTTFAAISDNIIPLLGPPRPARAGVREYELQLQRQQHRPELDKETLQNGYTDKQFDASTIRST